MPMDSVDWVEARDSGGHQRGKDRWEVSAGRNWLSERREMQEDHSAVAAALCRRTPHAGTAMPPGVSGEAPDTAPRRARNDEVVLE